MELVAALRSGEYEQARQVLKSSRGYCCLGVACEISGLGEWEEEVAEEGTNRYLYLNSHSSLPDQVKEHFGFKDNFGAIYDPTVRIRIPRAYSRRYAALASANDDGVTFAEIADFIEKNWESL